METLPTIPEQMSDRTPGLEISSFLCRPRLASGTTLDGSLTGALDLSAGSPTRDPEQKEEHAQG